MTVNDEIFDLDIFESYGSVSLINFSVFPNAAGSDGPVRKIDAILFSSTGFAVATVSYNIFLLYFRL